MKYPRVTIIVLNFNGLEDTRLCLRSLLNTTYRNISIIVVDNGSRQNEATILKREFKDKRIEIKRFNKNLGFSGGNNVILKHIKTDYIALVNNDVVVKKGWLAPIIKQMEKNKLIAVVQPKILWERDRRYFDYAGATGGFLDFLGYPFTRGRIFTTLEPDKGQHNKSTNIFWASGATMVIRKSVLEKVGLLDETFFNYMEEIDLCYRILQKGYQIVYEPKSVVFHKVASTASHNSTRKRFFEHRNNLLLILKNFPTVKLLYVIPIRLLMEIISIFYYLAIFRMDFARSVVGSIFSFLFLTPRYLYERNSRNSIDTTQMDRLIYPRSIVLAYFLLGKKTFNEVCKLAHWKVK